MQAGDGQSGRAALAHPRHDPWEGSEGRPVRLTWRPEAMTVLDPD